MMPPGDGKMAYGLEGNAARNAAECRKQELVNQLPKEE